MIEHPESAPRAGPGEKTPYAPAITGPPDAGRAEGADYRESLRSKRWDAAPLANPEVERTDPRIAVAFIAGLCALSFVIIVAGYATGFWG